jgi:hypothetical protein
MSNMVFSRFAMREVVSGSVTRRSIGKIVHVTQGSMASKYIRPYFDAMILTDIKAEHLIAFDAWLESKKLSERTRRTIFATLIQTFHQAVETVEWIPKSPMRRDSAPMWDKHKKAALTPRAGLAAVGHVS